MYFNVIQCKRLGSLLAFFCIQKKNQKIKIKKSSGKKALQKA